jgi:hypothetical protein
MWASAARWPGPDDHPGYQAAMAAGMVGASPRAIRDQVREWLGPQLDGLSLDEPTDWSGWDEQTRQ